MNRAISMLALSTMLAAPALAQTAPTAPAADAPAAVAAPAADAQAPAAEISGTYAFDPSHSHIVFSYDHLGYSISHGMVNGVTGTLKLDAENPQNSTVEASFPLSAISTVDKALDGHIYGEKMLNGAAPDTVVTFRSTSVAPEGDDEAKVTGELTLNGVTREVTLDVDLRKAGPHPMSQKMAAGFVAEGEIKRSDFNLGMFAPAVSDEMELRISVEAVKE